MISLPLILMSFAGHEDFSFQGGERTSKPIICIVSDVIAHQFYEIGRKGSFYVDT